MTEYLGGSGSYIEEVNFTAHQITGVGTSTAAFIDMFKKGPTGRATSISNFEELEDIFGGIDIRSEASYGIYQFFINGGRKAVVIRVPGRKRPRKRAILNGLKILPSDTQDSINILCIPAAANLNDKSTISVYDAAIEYCEDSRTFLILDIPKRVGHPDQMIEWVNKNTTLRSRNAAIYFPRIEISDPINSDQRREVSPGGTIAGIFARIDSERGVWKAPAGNEAALKGVMDLGHNVTDAENATLRSLGVNCIRNFPDQGNLCWGARTLEGNEQMSSEWKYIPVRRLFLYIEESVYRGTQWVVFEPNEERLWHKLRHQTEMFLHTLFRQGAILGSKAKEAYFVRCDRTTTSQEEIEKGVINILIGVAPSKPAEFALIKIQQMTG